MRTEDWEHLRTRSLPAVRNPADRALLERAACEFERHDVSGALDDAILGALAGALRGKSNIVREWAATWLMTIAAQQSHSQADQVIFAAFCDGVVAVRLTIIQQIAFSPRVPALEIELLRRGLVDRSGDVRLFAGQRIEHCGYAQLLDDLRRALEVERTAKVREHLSRSLHLLRDGYVVSDSGPSPDGSQPYIVRVKNGPLGDGWVGMDLPSAVRERLGVAEAVRRFRAWCERSEQGGRWDPV